MVADTPAPVPKRDKPRRWWTYRAARRNILRGRKHVGNTTPTERKNFLALFNQ